MDEAGKRLEQAGLEPTLNRVLVLTELRNSERPLTAKEAYERVLARHRLNRVTVYRILDLFAEKGVVRRIHSGERSLHYCCRESSWPHGHCHFHCLRCGAVQCLDAGRLPISEEALEAALPIAAGVVSNIELRFDGVCPACEAKTE